MNYGNVTLERTDSKTHHMSNECRNGIKVKLVKCFFKAQRLKRLKPSPELKRAYSVAYISIKVI